MRIYLGAAPGVGKTFAMLAEGRRRRERGTDVVIGYVETHGRSRTAAQVGDLEVVPRKAIDHRGSVFTEMDVDAVLRRRPEWVLVDEYAHTNVPGSRNAKRWQDVKELTDAGINVISTVNIQHLESLNDVVEQITGIRQGETVPDRAVRAADQIELVDMDPEALRRRMAHGNIYAAEKIDAALGNYFRQGNLSALRELALLWVADRVDDSLAEYRERHGIRRPWETRERVVVALSGAPGGEHLIRRAARIAQRAKGDLIGVHVVSDSGLSPSGPPVATETLTEQRTLLEELGGEYRKVTSSDVGTALLDVARSENATQIVLGASERSRWHELINGSVINRVVRRSGPIDIHVISRTATEEEAERAQLPSRRPRLTPLPPQRQLWGWIIAGVGLPLLTVVFAHTRHTVELSSVLLVYLVLAMLVALVGGMLPALAAAVAGSLLANFFFAPPFYRFTISEGENLLALVIYVVAAGLVAVLVDRVARIRSQAARSSAEAETLASLAGALAGPASLDDMLGQLRTAFGFRAAAVLRGADDVWVAVAASGVEPPMSPEEADVTRHLGREIVLALAGGELSEQDQRILNAFAAQVMVAAESERLQGEARRAGDLAAANRLRAALLHAVSHDLRTPLAAIKASISSLRQRDIEWPEDVIDDFQATIENETDRLSNLIADLLDMSRLQSAVLTVHLRPTAVEETVWTAIANAGPGSDSVDVDVSETLPAPHADPALLERALANIIANAIRYSPADAPPRVSAGLVRRDGRAFVDISVIDRGPGIRPEYRELVFQPFQRLVDIRADGKGVGLGLAIARGFVDAMNGELSIDDTPGGGTTMVISLPVEGQGHVVGDVA
jgi:two-component system sensor histidine kinase KdpD